ncbi:MAG: helix-turn-helix domain-containing protein [Hyphomicrobiaceae bacterium]
MTEISPLVQPNLETKTAISYATPVGGLSARVSRDASEAAARLVIDWLAARVLGVEPAVLTQPNRGRAPLALSRQTAMYLAHVTLGLTLTEVGRMFGRDRTTVAHACALIEDRRDDARTDLTLSLLEGLITAHLRRMGEDAGAGAAR